MSGVPASVLFKGKGDNMIYEWVYGYNDAVLFRPRACFHLPGAGSTIDNMEYIIAYLISEKPSDLRIKNHSL